MNARIPLGLGFLAACSAFVGPSVRAEDPSPALLEPTSSSQPVVLDDAIPPPKDEWVVAGADGDIVVASKVDDPHFLSFVAGRYHPPHDERLDPRLGDAIVAASNDGRGKDEIYAFLMLERRLTPERLSLLASFGVRPLGVMPHQTLQIAVPPAALASLAAHPEVRWIGVARSWQKVHPHLAARLESAANDAVPVHVSLFESDLNERSTSTPGPNAQIGDPGSAIVEATDASTGRRVTSNGWMQRALEAIGIEITSYDPDRHVFGAKLRTHQLARLVALDFVQFVESSLPLEPHHDESMPMILADWGRATHDGATSQAVIAGMIDSGFDAQHSALDHVFYVGWDESGSGSGATFDGCGHGSHVAGTILGKPTAANSGLRGAAPNLATWQSGRFRFVKYHDDLCVPSSVDYANIVSHLRGNFVDSFGVVSPPPMVINNSYGTPGAWFGSEYTARIVDDEVYDNDQVYVFSAGNSGPNSGTISVPGVAKNALTVGSVYNWNKSTVEPPGTVTVSSSRGPCADGRWKPNVVAPGDSIRSVDAETANQFVESTGTSMAAPHVTGVVSQLMDRFSTMRYAPERVLSLIQATAITKGDVELVTETDSHLANYGCGRVNAGKLLNSLATDWSWTNWQVTPAAAIGSPIVELGDFVVPSGTRRLVVCMSYIEPSCLPGAGAALLHDFDLYIDKPPISPTGNIGDYTAQISSADNTEIRIIDDPDPGVWRWKAYPTNVVAPLFDPAKMSITVVLISGDTTPTGSISISAEEQFVKPGEVIDVTATATANSYVASAVFLDTTGSPTPPSITAATAQLADGATANLLGNKHSGHDVLLGDILGQSGRDVTWSMYWASEGVRNFAVNALSDNYAPSLASVNVVVDGTPPTSPTGVFSTSHETGEWSNDPTVDLTWVAGTDALSGIDGYSLVASPNVSTMPDEVKETSLTSHTVALPPSVADQYISVRSLDKSGNGSSQYFSDGPFKIDTSLPPLVAVISSPSHTAFQWSKNPKLEVEWQHPFDTYSGVAGYSILVSSGGTAVPDATLDLGLVTQHTVTLPSSTTGQYFNIRTLDAAKNATSGAASIGPYFIDATPPAAPTNLASTTHSIGVPSTATDITVTWTAATDAHSGVTAYAINFDHEPTTAATSVYASGNTSITFPLSVSELDWWVHVRAVDVVGNLGPTSHLGPFRIGVCTGAATATSYGAGKPGSNGVPFLIATHPPILGGTAEIEIQNGQPGALPILLIGVAPSNAFFEGGTLLVAPILVANLPIAIDPTGTLPIAGALPADPLLCGANVYLQALVPDSGASGPNQLAMTPGLRLILGS